MKKTLFTLAILAACSMAAFANPICESREWAGKGERKRAECYQLAVNGGTARMRENYKRIKASTRVTDLQKTLIDEDHVRWLKENKEKCPNSDNVCLYSQISVRNDQIEGFMKSHALTPL